MNEHKFVKDLENVLDNALELKNETQALSFSTQRSNEFLRKGYTILEGFAVTM